jgi:hypothetical protein
MWIYYVVSVVDVRIAVTIVVYIVEKICLNQLHVGHVMIVVYVILLALDVELQYIVGIAVGSAKNVKFVALVVDVMSNGQIVTIAENIMMQRYIQQDVLMDVNQIYAIAEQHMRLAQSVEVNTAQLI